MSNAFRFDIQGWQANQLAMEAQKASTKGVEVETETNQFKLRLAKKAAESQAAVEKALRENPKLLENADKDPARTLASMARLLAIGGQFEAAADLLSKSAIASKDSSEAAESRLDARIKQGKQIASAMEGVEAAEDPASEWNSAVAGLLALYPEDAERIEALATMPFEAGGAFDYARSASKIRQTAHTEIEKAEMERKRIAALYSEQAAAESFARETILIPAQADAQRASAEYRRKMGDYIKGLKSTTIADAKSIIERDYKATPEHLQVLGAELDERAEVIMRIIPTIGRTNALKQAYGEMKADGKFAGLGVRTPSAGGSVRNPLALPLEDGKVDETQLQKNKIYKLPAKFGGKPAMWDGENFVPVTEGVYDRIAAGEELPEDEQEGFDEGFEEGLEETPEEDY